VVTEEEGPADSTALVSSLLIAAEACGADAGQLARDAEIPSWALSAGPMMLPLRYARSVWELTEHALGTADVPLAMASQSVPGRYGVLDYLFATAHTVRAGLAAVADSLHLWTTNGRLGIETGDDGTATWSYYWRVAPGGPAEGLASQYLAVSVMRVIQMATGRPVMPLQVTFAHDPPRSHRALGEALGTAQLHFGAPLTTVTFRAPDLDLPLRGADPVLAGILTQYVGSLPAAPLADWRELFRVQLAQALAAGTPTLAEVARRMAASTRTVQRRLAEHGTTWRAELEAARQVLASNSTADRTALARRLGYADSRSARRVLRQWKSHS
jgi:AraC-like DNA-binding protein